MAPHPEPPRGGTEEGDALRRIPLALLVAGLAVAAALFSPLLVGMTTTAGAATHTPAPVVSSLAPASPAAARGAHPSSGQCPTPQTLPHWAGPSFFNDAFVSFTVPGYKNLSDGNFDTVPCTNFLPEYVPGFWMNITTDVPLTQAYLTIWGTGWPTASNPDPVLPGYDYNAPTVRPMEINSTFPEHAVFYFDTYRFFYPGTTIDFNVTLDSANATPSTINSASDGASAIIPGGTNDNATWSFSLNTPWWSNHFTNDIRIFTNPPILGGEVFEPNSNQSFSIGLESVGPTGNPGGPIPIATLSFSLTGQITGNYGADFGPANHTWENLTAPVGPYPNEKFSFNVTAYLPWEGGRIDPIMSPSYAFNWTSGGSWWSPSLGLEQNARLSSSPAVLNGSPTTLPTATPVNVSVLEPLPNVTINSAVLHFHYSDVSGSVSGGLPMKPVTQNRTYAVIPGLPPGGHLTFSVLAKDVHDNPLASGNYSYSETGNSSFVTPGPTYSFFFVEAVDATTGALIPGAHYTVGNSTWSDSALTTPLGFGALQIPNGAGFLALPIQTYTVTMTALNHTESALVILSSGQPIVVHFWFASGAVPGSSTVIPIPVTVGLVAGLAVATVAFVPLFNWFKERQARAEEERRRVTL